MRAARPTGTLPLHSEVARSVAWRVVNGRRAWYTVRAERGCRRDYGHTDVLLGRSAPEVVFPLIRDFLLEKSEVCATAGA